MPPPQGFFSFPGIIAATDGRYQCGHGTAPGRIIIDAAYQDTPVLEVGDLTIGYGNQYFVVRDCKVQEQISYYDPNGHWKTEYLLEDRRWRWRFGEIEGNYNRRIGSGKIDETCERTPQQLAKLLFEAMKEQRFDFSALPNEARPEVLWLGANPALELERLASDLGCRLVYDPLTDTVIIRKSGQGAFLPRLNSVDQVGENRVKPPVPSAIRIVGTQPTRIQMALELRNLVEDTDGQLVEPDKLSFFGELIDDTGNDNWWLQEAVEGDPSDWFPNISDDEHRKLVQKTMWRYYRPILPKGNDPRVGKIEQYLRADGQSLRLENISLELNEEYPVDSSSGGGAFGGGGGETFTEWTKRGYVAGTFNLSSNGGPFGVGVGPRENSSADRNDTVYEGSFQIVNTGDVVDTDKPQTERKGHDFPYIIFDRPVWQWDDDGNKIPPSGNLNGNEPNKKLYLVCTFNVRNASAQQTCSLHHYNYLYTLTGDPKIGPEVYLDSSLQLRPIEGFNKQIISFGPSIEDNTITDDLLLRSQEIALNRAQEYNVKEAGNATYQEFILVNLDGAIQSVLWKFGAGGATTEVHRNSEPDYIATKYDRRLTFNEIKRKAGVT